MNLTGLFWLSFADPKLPKGKQFLGAVVIRADDMIEAIKRSHFLGINPGGEVEGHPVIYLAGVDPIPDSFKERLLSRSEIDRLMALIDNRKGPN